MILLIAAALVWNYYDVNIFLNWIKIYDELGLLYLYTMYKYNQSYRVVYLPLAPLTFIAFYSLGEKTTNILLNNTLIPLTPEYSESVKLTLIRIFSKIPLVLMVYLTAYLFYKKERNGEIIKWWFYNIPLILAVATYQFDPIMVFFLLLGTYLIVEEKLVHAGISWGVGAAIKHVPVILLPIVYMFLGDKTRFTKFLASFIITVLIISLPFLIVDPIGFINNALGFHTDRPPQYLSIFNIPVLLSNRDPVVTNVVIKLWPYIFAIIYITCILLLNPKPNDKDSLFESILVVLLVFTVFNKVVNPNYLLWAYPYAIYVLLKKNKIRSLKLLIIASIIAMSWPGICFYTAAVLDKAVYIEEEMRYYDARLLVEKSFQGYGKILLQLVLSIGYELKPLIQIIYDNLNLVGVIMISSYVGIVLYILLVDIGGVKNIDDLVLKLGGLKHKLKSWLRTISSYIKH